MLNRMMLNSKLEKMKEKIRTSTPLLVAVIAFLFVILIGFLAQKEQEKQYEISGKEMHSKLMKKQYMLAPEELSTLINKKSQEYILIDLRTPFEYQKAHIKGAVNIPYQNMFAEEYANLWSSEGLKIIYHDSQDKACAPYMLLSQVGIEDCKVLLGGFSFYNKVYIEGDKTITNYANEKALYDFSKLVGEKTKLISTGKKVRQAKPMLKKKKKKSVDGGC